MRSARFLTFLFILHVQCAYCARILLVAGPMYSHMAQYVAIGSELVKMGHEISLITPETFPVDNIVGNSGISVIKYKPPPLDVPQTFGKDMDDHVMKVSFSPPSSPLEALRDMSERAIHLCDAILSDENFIHQLKTMDFNLMLVDSLIFMRCMALLPKKLGVPFMTESPLPEQFLAGAPFLPSVSPIPKSAEAATNLNFFTGRLRSLIEAALFNMVDLPLNGHWLIEKHLPGRESGLRFRDIVSESLFWLCGTLDPVLDYPRAITPNMALVGGLTTKPAKPLPAKLEKYMSNAKHGVIIFSFGSVANKFPPVYLQNFLDAFSRLKQNVLMKVGDATSLKPSANVRIEKWLPQNDLLGHNNTKLFITHGGANGIYEALYHGVPMLAVPVMPSDQPYNANKIKDKGFGLSLDLLKLTPDDVYNSVTKILNDPRYEQNIKRASKAFRDAPMTPRQTAAFWVDYISKHGGDFVRPLALGMPWWKSTMIDLYAFITVCLLLILWICFICLRYCYRRLFNKNPQQMNCTKKNN